MVLVRSHGAANSSLPCSTDTILRPKLNCRLHQSKGCLTQWARVPLLGWAGPETVCHCLEKAVRGGPKRTGARTFAQNRAVWERPRFSRWPCRRSGAPASVALTPAGPVCHAHGCPRGPDIRRFVCPCFVVRRHGLQPARPASERCQTTGVRASSKGKRADVGAICRRARAIEYYPGRKDRQTAPRRLVRLER